MKKFPEEFKIFALHGNVMDMAIGIITVTAGQILQDLLLPLSLLS